MGYFSQALYGLSWVGSFRLVTRLIAFGRIAILARLLSPDQFGVYGIATLVLAFLEITTETGINVVLIQEKKNLAKYVNTAWIVSISRGLLIALVILLTSPFIARFFNSPQSFRLILLISLVPLLRGFINPSIIKFQKELQFNKDFVLRTTVFVVDSAVSVILALIIQDPIALIWGLLAGVIAEVLISHAFVSPKPRFAYDASQVKEIVKRGKWVTFAGIFDYLFRQTDDAVVGKLLGEHQLGIYQNAYKIATLPITEIGHVVFKVVFPVMTKMSLYKDRLKVAYYKTTAGVALLTLPVVLVVFVFPREVVLVLLGDKWVEAVPIIRILCVYGFVRAVIGVSYSLFLALKKQEYVTITTLVGILGLGISVVPLATLYGLVGVAASTVVGSLATVLPAVYFVRKALRTL